MEIQILISIVTGIIALVGLIFSIIWNTIHLKKSNVIQSDMLIQDMVKEEISNWKYIHEQKKYYLDERKKEIPSSVKSHIMNYYEYLAYLIRIGKINEAHAKRIWKPNIYGAFDDFPNEFSGNRKELRRLYYKWKSKEK